MKRKKPIKKISDKRAKQMREYKIVRTNYLLDHPICECEGCNNQATDIHHKKGRSGAMLCDVEFFLATCRGCHTKIEINPKWAKEKGYSVSRLAL